jgi:hypothetical protein
MEEAMKTRSIAAVIAVTVAAGPLFADMPDGHGGRTSPQASPRAVAPPAHACCPQTTRVATNAQPLAPAERKAIGEVAWTSGHLTTLTGKVACYKMNARATTPYSSPAELKAVGHLDRSPAPTRTASAPCCDSASCPMRKAS